MSSCMSALSGMHSVELSEGLKQLKSEHPPLLEKLEELYDLTQLIAQEENVEKNFVELMIKVKEFKRALDPHSEREEGVLFQMMGAYIGKTSGPIAVMEYEHDQAKLNIHNFLEKSENGFDTLEEGQELAGFIQNAYFILTDHFAKEENVLFPMAERMLSNEEKAELYKRIQEIS